MKQRKLGMKQMKQKNKLVEVLDDIVDSENQNDFSIVTYRTVQKTATMIDIMGVVLQQPVSALFTNLISEKLVENVLQDQTNMDLLKEYFKTDHSNSGFLKILEKDGIIEEDFEDYVPADLLELDL